jgi:Putative peptidoglycan binding domain
MTPSSAQDSPVESTPAPMAAVQPVDTRSPATSRDDDAAGVRTRGTPSPAETERDPLNRSDATSIQRRLRDLGYYFGDGNGVWGAGSRKALRDFKSRNGMQEDDRWDRETEERLWSRPAVRAARTFIGGWVLEGDECGHREGSAQLIINSRRAEAAGGKCDFRSIKQEAASKWRIRAICSATGQAWNANIDLAVIGPNLRWSSERGTETYVRCLKR